MRRKHDLVDLEVVVIHQTERAVLVSLTEDGEKVWLPLSAIEVNTRKNRTAEITLPEAMAIEKGLV